jgi:flavin reductase (DIM6/NTAB) family NADH-FMN oxidoreductase RutF
MTLQNYSYHWPQADLATDPAWSLDAATGFRSRVMPESAEDLARDSRWPAFFPCPLVLVTTSDGESVLLEKVVGASVVNRFPYTLALSFCTKALSARHHVRHSFVEALERSGVAAVQFLPPGAALDAAMKAILEVPEEQTAGRIAASGLATRPARTIDAPVFRDAYMVYECRAVRPGKDFEGQAINALPYADVGSHRVFFLEITSIQLREDIARGSSQIHWRALPLWQPATAATSGAGKASAEALARLGYVKGYTPQYAFPSAGTTAFEADGLKDGMAFRDLAPLPEDQVEVDNDRARWPCFFPSSVGMITSWSETGAANVMPCGSTTIISRHPLVVAPCVSYAAINARYAPRQSLPDIRRLGRFGCGVPFIDEAMVAAIRYSGNVSIVQDADKLRNSGLTLASASGPSPVLADMPVHFDCRVTGEICLGTHVMFLGEVERILVRADVSPNNPLSWIPWADVRPVIKEAE